MNLKKTERRLWLLPNYIGTKHPDAWLPEFYKEKLPHFDLIFCESYRSAETLLNRQDLPEIELFEINEHTNWKKVILDVEQILATKNEIGLLSDAGLPCVADPGERIVALAHQYQFTIKSLPGANSMILALASSGINSEKFTFKGYLPIDKQERNNELNRMLDSIKQKKETQIFMETPYRNHDLFETVINRVSDQMQLSISKDLLGREEETKSMIIKKWKEFENPKAWMHKKPAVFVLGEAIV